MFKIEYIKDNDSINNTVLMYDSTRKSMAKIALNLGGSLQELLLKKNEIIKNIHSLNFQTSYASAILFPFVNRIKDGKYSFQNQNHQLELNKKEVHNAIHGLISKKKYILVNQETTENFASITLSYCEFENPKGFPFNYTVLLTYTLTLDTLELKVNVKNDGSKTFPFSIGWHPYFYSNNLYNSFIIFNSDEKIIVDKQQIPVKTTNISLDADLQIKDKKLDDCYHLKNNTMGFKTPDYHINISSSTKDNYLQLYTPSEKNFIAIEPMTAPSNSFNNKIGLQELNPNKTYQISWLIKLLESE